MSGTTNIADPIRIISPVRFVSAAAVLITIALVTPDQALAEKIEGKKSREDVAEACEAADGVAYNTEGSKGEYGCVTDNAWIECDDGGNCQGVVVTDDATTKQVRLAIRRWTQVSRPILNPGTGACGGCLHLAVKAQHLDRRGDALVQEAKGLLRRAKLGKIPNRQHARTAHRRLAQVARQLNQTTIQRKELLVEHRSLVGKANFYNLPKKPISTQQPTVRANPGATKLPSTASSRKQLEIN